MMLATTGYSFVLYIVDGYLNTISRCLKTIDSANTGRG